MKTGVKTSDLTLEVRLLEQAAKRMDYWAYCARITRPEECLFWNKSARETRNVIDTILMRRLQYGLPIHSTRPRTYKKRAKA